ncbi:unnamed protein product [Rotaria socialis]|uniref:Uncharacterized protein n=1 Tax=Rotaria socialis TaxID=392032 RepID=A0A821VYU1_9BILA|nr:unnamed protein product [Rotaria socialis]
MPLANRLAKLTNIYLGFPIFIGGTLGNLLHILLLWPNRRNSCAFLFLFSSLINYIALFYGLFTRILSDSFDSDWSTTNRIWCKSRVALTSTTFFYLINIHLPSKYGSVFLKLSPKKIQKIHLIIISNMDSDSTIVF